jgi:hypothetical protein
MSRKEKLFWCALVVGALVALCFIGQANMASGVIIGFSGCTILNQIHES